MMRNSLAIGGATAAYLGGRKVEQRNHNVKRSANAKKGWETRRLAKQAMFGIPMGKATKNISLRRSSAAPIGLDRSEIDKVKRAIKEQSAKRMTKQADSNSVPTSLTKEVKSALKTMHLNPKTPITSYLKSKVMREVKHELSNKG